MYNERRDSFSIKTVILQFLFVALFIFLLIWLFPSKSYLNNNGSETADMSVFYDRIFNENVIAMKDAAKDYFTNPRLPQNVGDKVSITLGEMLEKKIILPFVDSKGKQCSLTKSYVEITKYDEEYVMKVNLKCSEQENYLLVYMGCYDYCTTDICEKNKSDVKTPVIYPAPKPTPQPEKKPEPEKKPDPEVKVPESSPACSLNVVSGNKKGNAYTGTVVIGFKSKVAGDNATLTGFGLGTNTNYNGSERYSLTNAGTYTIYGYVKNSFGKTSTCSIKVTIAEKEYEYEYSKTTTKCSAYSNWSDWSTDYAEPTNLREVAYRKVKTTSITGYKKTTYNDTSKPIYGTKDVAIGTYTEKVCTEYGYEATGQVAYTDWVYQGYVTTTSILKNTDLEKYVPVTDTETLCQQYCSSTTGHVYKKYTRTALNSVKYTCKNYATVSKLVTAQKTVITGYETYTKEEPITETKVVTQYRYRTRTCSTNTDKKWSYHNNTKLLNDGYKYTGEKREK